MWFLRRVANISLLYQADIGRHFEEVSSTCLLLVQRVVGCLMADASEAALTHCESLLRLKHRFVSTGPGEGGRWCQCLKLSQIITIDESYSAVTVLLRGTTIRFVLNF